MLRRKQKIVLFLPQRADPAQGEIFSADLLPLELLQIASGPAAAGWEVVLIDAMVEPDYLEKCLEACGDAVLFASSCILGYQVYDGYLTARAVRERHPELPIIWGGWFPSVLPEMYLQEGIADAVGLGQGEVTFMEVCQAIEAGEDLERVPGLALMRGGELVRTETRAVVGFDALPPVPWQLLDYERYARLQVEPGGPKVRHRFPLPGEWTAENPPRGFSYYSSFGCPRDCTFCCSPRVSRRRWKAIPGDVLAEDVAELQERFRFDVLRFQDANFGVAPRRLRAFCERAVELDLGIHWNATIEVETIDRCDQGTLDLLQESGCHLLWLGAETATWEMQQRIRKNIPPDHIPRAIGELAGRDIIPGTFWMIGYPGETRESMIETLRQAARVKHAWPICGSEVYPFRPIPGTEDFDAAVELGYDPPRSFREWGRCFEYKYDTQSTPLPEDVRERWRRYNNTAALYDKHVSEGPRWMRELLSRIAGWRLRTDRYRFPLEQKLYDVYARATGQVRPGPESRPPAIDA